MVASTAGDEPGGPAGPAERRPLTGRPSAVRLVRPVPGMGRLAMAVAVAVLAGALSAGILGA